MEEIGQLETFLVSIVENPQLQRDSMKFKVDLCFTT